MLTGIRNSLAGSVFGEINTLCFSLRAAHFCPLDPWNNSWISVISSRRLAAEAGSILDSINILNSF